MNVSVEIIAAAWLGAFFGALARTLLPWFRKLREEPDIKWNPTYTITFIYALFMSFIIACFIALQLDITSVNSAFTAFLLGATTAYTLNDLQNDLVKSKKTYVPIPKEHQGGL